MVFETSVFPHWQKSSNKGTPPNWRSNTQTHKPMGASLIPIATASLFDPAMSTWARISIPAFFTAPLFDLIQGLAKGQVYLELNILPIALASEDFLRKWEWNFPALTLC